MILEKSPDAWLVWEQVKTATLFLSLKAQILVGSQVYLVDGRMSFKLSNVLQRASGVSDVLSISWLCCIWSSLRTSLGKGHVRDV